ncbi:hypothetical protein [Acidocella sp.]|uniref:hypothetical protein n=1 Tax=Acidocella sp. TaxID=50710 RepID=UPI0026266F67|nr:hypothetical protein [Acidocella sp.]
MRKIKDLYHPATGREEANIWRDGIIPVSLKADRYARGVGGAATRKIKDLYHPATGREESNIWRDGIRDCFKQPPPQKLKLLNIFAEFGASPHARTNGARGSVL